MPAGISTSIRRLNRATPPDASLTSADRQRPAESPAVKTLDIAGIAAALGDLARRFDVDVVAECDSTNSRLLALAEAGAAAGSVLAAERQTAGRGRRGREWLSASGDSLTFSLLWRFPPRLPLSGLSLAVGVALARALDSLDIPGVALKWPNDVLLNGRKLAGVLIEMAPGARSGAVVIGVGMNLRLPREMPETLRQTSAALTEAGTALPSPSILLAQLLTALHDVLQSFAAEGFAGQRQAWLLRHAYEGQRVCLLSDFAAPLQGHCRGVDGDGALLLETATGLQRIVSGEVSLRAAP
ncbi:MAG: biotin--[acetyl-CoA-carboxylase] ligase [Betaproteobacteria bacterium]|nr:biotin--[acetyl-CoA-carboxylase] ligase [Betaproteobacteria bacterium]